MEEFIGLDIKTIVNNVITKYATNDPYDICRQLKITVLHHALPSTLKGYRIDKIIILNQELDINEEKCVLSHELGHYFLHDYISWGNCFKNELLVKGKYEREADIFASELLLSNIHNYLDNQLTYNQLAALFCVPIEFVKYKVENLKEVNQNDCCNL